MVPNCVPAGGMKKEEDLKHGFKRKMGRHWGTEEEWKISTLWKKICKWWFKKKVSKCVPLAKATAMSSSQRANAVSRKRSAGNTGSKPTNVKTFASKGAFTKLYYGGMIDL